MNPLISIIIPVYQTESYLKKCIDSARNQTYANLEIILVDDGSTDNCPKFCDDYRALDNRIKVIHQENGGAAAARNAGLDAASGKYIAFLDSDDWMGRRYIERLHGVIERERCDIAQCGHFDVIDEAVRHKTRTDRCPMTFTGREFSYYAYTLNPWSFFVVWNKLYKKALWEGIRFPNGRVYEDEAVTYQVAWKAGKVATINEKLYFYRHRAGSIMGSHSRERFDIKAPFRERADFYGAQGERQLRWFTQKAHSAKIFGFLNELSSSKGFENMDKGLLEKLWEERNRLEHETQRPGNGIMPVTYMGYLFPFSQIAYGSKIVLYGAGKMGSTFYRQVAASNYCDVLLWVDLQHRKYRRDHGYPVSPVDEIGNCAGEDYDHVVVAVRDEASAADIIHELVHRYGVSPGKIVYEMDAI